jgi:glycosyltransferase involved in cell wall biosynthesis
MSTPDVSVIIPCYNHGQFINQAIDSVLTQTHQNFEIIAVNDGSTDVDTVETMKRINHPKIKVIHTTNQGLAAARNNGIRQAQSEIILPLDSDDMISPQYIEKAIPVLRENPGVGIVYCQAMLFGEKRGKWVLPEFSLTQMLFMNLIFHCAFFRQSDWEKVNGYNPNMKYGWEDWDFWLSIISLERKVYCIPEVLHSYRIRKNSMVHNMEEQKKAEMHAQLFLNHQDLYKKNLVDFFKEVHKAEDIAHRSVVKRLVFDKLLNPIQLLKNFKYHFNVQP